MTNDQRGSKKAVSAETPARDLLGQSTQDCTACYTRGYILAMGDVLADIEGLRSMIKESGRMPDAETLLGLVEKDVRESLFSAKGGLAELLGQEEE